jgi:hypothetical protein
LISSFLGRSGVRRSSGLMTSRITARSRQHNGRGRHAEPDGCTLNACVDPFR